MISWSNRLRDVGFVFAQAPQMRAALKVEGLQDWEGFARSWGNLGLDTYMADGGRYRKRRHAAFRMEMDGAVRKPHQAHYQSRDYNALNGGIARWFDPMLGNYHPEKAECVRNTKSPLRWSAPGFLFWRSLGVLLRGRFQATGC